MAKLKIALAQIDTKLGEMREANTFSESAKRDIYTLYKRLRYYYRSSDEVLIEGSEKACAEFIISFFKHYPDIRTQMLGIVREMKDAWQKEMKEKTDLAYFG